MNWGPVLRPSRFWDWAIFGIRPVLGSGQFWVVPVFFGLGQFWLDQFWFKPVFGWASYYKPVLGQAVMSGPVLGFNQSIDPITNAKGAKLATATVPWHWLVFCLASRLCYETPRNYEYLSKKHRGLEVAMVDFSPD